jgi:hypothetical protein
MKIPRLCDPMDAILIERIQGWQIATARARHGLRRWWAWGKMGSIQGDSPLTEPGSHVWCEFGDSREEASRKLKQELGLLVTTSGASA